MSAASNFTSIFDLVTPEHGVDVAGVRMRIVKLGPSAMVPLLKRFPEMRQIEQLQFASDGEISLEDLDPDKLEKLGRLVEFNNAMTAAALGHLNDLKVEAMVDAKFDDDDKIRIISAAQELATGTVDEGFSKRSA